VLDDSHICRLDPMPRQVAIRVARPPTGANCTVTPSRGKALTTDFRVKCWGWAAGDALAGPLTYAFQAVTSDGARVALGTYNTSATTVNCLSNV
jgi:hypothetical protein